jgi:hypothetical protein
MIEQGPVDHAILKTRVPMTEAVVPGKSATQRQGIMRKRASQPGNGKNTRDVSHRWKRPSVFAARCAPSPQKGRSYHQHAKTGQFGNAAGLGELFGGNH